MRKCSCYLVCHEHITEVREFLAQFFDEYKGKYNYGSWMTFKTPTFNINLMQGKEFELTQNMNFEIECESLQELKTYAKKFNKPIKDFVTEKPVSYRFHYVELEGPKGICNVDISYLEDL